jgi:E3 ubiquitin-protein ligase UBR7
MRLTNERTPRQLTTREFRDDLVKFLRPFAQDGKVVNESDVHEFFDSLKEAAAKKARE